MVQQSKSEGGVTGFDLIAFILVIVLIVYIALNLNSNEIVTGRGVLHAYVSNTGNLLQCVGPVTLFSATNGVQSGVDVRYRNPRPDQMGAVQLNVALFIGSMGGIDFDKVRVVWISNGVVETIPRNDMRPLICPGWTIVGKYNEIPSKSANGNDILDPGEQFEIFACPTDTTAPYQHFSLVISLPGSVAPPLVSASAPPMVYPIVRLM
jgi:hypothetical protein